MGGSGLGVVAVVAATNKLLPLSISQLSLTAITLSDPTFGLYVYKSLKGRRKMVGTGRFELPTPRTPSECSTRLSHVPTEGIRSAIRHGWG